MILMPHHSARLGRRARDSFKLRLKFVSSRTDWMELKVTKCRTMARATARLAGMEKDPSESLRLIVFYTFSCLKKMANAPEGSNQILLSDVSTDRTLGRTIFVHLTPGCQEETFQRRPKGFSLAITIFRRMSHAFLSVSRKLTQSTGPIAGRANCLY